MPGASDAIVGNIGAGTPATGARTARLANGVVGVNAIDIESSITAAADVTSQQLEHRRFVSAPLAATTFSAADGNWTFSCAGSESNTNHNGQLAVEIYLWRPSTGLRVGGTVHVFIGGAIMAATAETAYSGTGVWTATQAILDGDILGFDVHTGFTQSMSTAYTEQFAYDGTTEASTTSCASFVTPPVPLTLFTPTPHADVAMGLRVT
jgi:hypothetical protein